VRMMSVPRGSEVLPDNARHRSSTLFWRRRRMTYTSIGDLAPGQNSFKCP
jgi:hypothetical protein